MTIVIEPGRRTEQLVEPYFAKPGARNKDEIFALAHKSLPLYRLWVVGIKCFVN
jgi:hypothetical protein